MKQTLSGVCEFVCVCFVCVCVCVCVARDPSHCRSALTITKMQAQPLRYCMHQMVSPNCRIFTPIVISERQVRRLIDLSFSLSLSLSLSLCVCVCVCVCARARAYYQRFCRRHGLGREQKQQVRLLVIL